MTTIKVNTVTDAAGTGSPNIPDGVTIAGTALASVPQMEYTSSASEPSSPSDGALWWDSANKLFKMYVNDEWYEVDYTLPPPAYLGTRGIYAGGADSSYTNVIQYITITTAGNATDFGDLGEQRAYPGGGSNGTRAVVAGGVYGNAKDTIYYFAIATTGNASTFGTLTTRRSRLAGLSNKTRAVFGGGQDIGGQTDNTMDYITVDTTGNATDFGDITNFNAGTQYGGTNSKTRGLWGGTALGGTKTIEYITIDTPSNTTDFGNLSVSRSGPAACTDGLRAVFGGGQNNNTTMDYVSIDTLGDATDFGDLDQGLSNMAGTSDGTTGIFFGGYTSSFGGIARNYIQSITVQTPSNATDFGDLLTARFGGCGLSGG